MRIALECTWRREISWLHRLPNFLQFQTCEKWTTKIWFSSRIYWEGNIISLSHTTVTDRNDTVFAGHSFTWPLCLLRIIIFSCHRERRHIRRFFHVFSIHWWFAQESLAIHCEGAQMIRDWTWIIHKRLCSECHSLTGLKRVFTIRSVTKFDLFIKCSHRTLRSND